MAGELAPAVRGHLAVLASRPTMMWPPKALQASRESRVLHGGRADDDVEMPGVDVALDGVQVADAPPSCTGMSSPTSSRWPDGRLVLGLPGKRAVQVPPGADGARPHPPTLRAMAAGLRQRWSIGWRSSAPSSPQAARPCTCPSSPDDPRVVDSTGALALQGVPKRCSSSAAASSAWKWARCTATLGARLDVVEMMDGLMQGTAIWSKSGKK